MKNLLCGIFIPQLEQENNKLKKQIESLSILVNYSFSSERPRAS